MIFFLPYKFYDLARANLHLSTEILENDYRMTTEKIQNVCTYSLILSIKV